MMDELFKNPGKYRRMSNAPVRLRGAVKAEAICRCLWHHEASGCCRRIQIAETIALTDELARQLAR